MTTSHDAVALDWRHIAKAAGEHGVRYRTNTALVAFLDAVRPPAQAGAASVEVVRRLHREIVRNREEANMDDRAAVATKNPDAAQHFVASAFAKRERANDIEAMLALATPAASGEIPAGMGRYLADRFQWAAPGDQQEDAWLVRFCDNDVRDAIYTGPDAESEAWAAWNRHAPGYNMYVFRLAALSTPKASAETSGAGPIEAAARAMCDRVNGAGDYDENVAQRRPGWVPQAQAGINAYLAALSAAPSAPATEAGDEA